jgi:hypothetical protein
MKMMTTQVCLLMEESSDLSGDDQFVFYKHELHFSTVDRRILYTSGRWLIAINCSSHHCSALVMAQAHQMRPPLLQAQHQAQAVLVAVIVANASRCFVL